MGSTRAVNAVDASALCHRCRNPDRTAFTRPIVRDATSYLLADLRVCSMTGTGAAGSMPPVITDVALQSVLSSRNFTNAFSAAILRYWELHRWTGQYAGVNSSIYRLFLRVLIG